MYVQPTDPLPRNSQDPMTACEIARAQATVANMEQAVANAQAASASIAGPSSFAQFGPAVVIDVARSQNGMASAGISKIQPSTSSPSFFFQGSSFFSQFGPAGVQSLQPSTAPFPTLSMELMAAPKVLPLNVTVQEYSGCSMRGSGPLRPIRVAPQVVTMPARAPEPVYVPQNASAPQYKNLCWGLRNGMVSQDQFDPSEYMALYVACSQKGYAGGCPPPPLTALWLDQQRRAGTLPHITVRPSDLDAIPQAPDLQAKNCAEAKALEGLSGYRRGLGAVWGDAGSVPTTDAWLGTSGASAFSWSALLVLAAIGAGLYLVGNNGSR